MRLRKSQAWPWAMRRKGRLRVDESHPPARHGDTPIAGWFLVEKPLKIWMMTRGTPISGKLHMKHYETYMKQLLNWSQCCGNSDKKTWVLGMV